MLNFRRPSPIANSASGPAMSASASISRTTKGGRSIPVTRQMTPARMPIISELGSTRLRNARKISPARNRTGFPVTENVEQDDRDHGHGRHVDGNQQRQDLETLLPEDAEHERDAEKHEVRIGGSNAADYADLGVAPENPGHRQVADEPGNRCG